MGSPNPLDSTAPRIKRGKEKELPKLKRPTALKKASVLNLNVGGIPAPRLQGYEFLPSWNAFCVEFVCFHCRYVFVSFRL